MDRSGFPALGATAIAVTALWLVTSCGGTGVADVATGVSSAAEHSPSHPHDPEPQPPPVSVAPPIGELVLYAERSVEVGEHARIDGAAVGVATVADPGFGPQAVIGEHAKLEESSVISPSVYLGRGADVDGLETNSLESLGGKHGEVLPYPSGMPPLPFASASGSGVAVTVRSHGHRRLSPGHYGALHLGMHSRLVLAAGTYSFASIALDGHAELVGDPGGVVIQVIGAVTIADHGSVAPPARHDHPVAGELVIMVAGGDGVHDTPVVRVGEGAYVTALIAAPNGTVSVASFAHVTGALAGFDVKVASRASVEFDSGFPASLPGSQGSQQLQGYLANPTDGAFVVLGTVPPDTVLQVEVGLPVRDPAGLKSFVDSVSNPSSPSYRKFLAPAQFKSTYGATDADYQALVSWAGSMGFTVRSTFSNNLLLSVNATGAQLSQALHANLRYRLRADGSRTSFPVVDREPSVDLDVPLLWITGLSDYLLPTAKACTACNLQDPAGYTRNGTGGARMYLSSDIRAAYLGVGSSCSGLTGAGETVGILSLEGFRPSDIAAYVAANPGLDVNNLSVVYGSNDGQTGQGETTLDIEAVMAMAPGAAVHVFETGTGVTGHADDVLHAMATAAVPLSTATCSWSFGRSDNSEQALSQMAAQGTSFFDASGDYGAIGDEQGEVDMDHLTIVGGTVLSTNLPTSSTRPSPTYPSNYYAGENTWNEGCPFVDYVVPPGQPPGGPLYCPLCPSGGGPFCASSNSGKDISGGGILDGNHNTQMQPGGPFGTTPCFCWPYPLCCGSGVSIPGYQDPSLMQPIAAGGNGGSQVFRNYPDVSGVAWDWGVIIGGSLQSVGGTSAAAPLWAGFMALADQQSKMNQQVGPVGFANWALYQIGMTRGLPGGNDLYATSFHDVADGVFNSATTQTCENECAPGVQGYPAVAGYDLATGWGSPTCGLIQQLATFNPTVPATFDSVALHLENGHDGINDQSSVSLDLFGPDAATQIGHFVVKPQGANGWDGIGLVFDRVIQLPSPIPANGIDHVVVNLEENGQGGIFGDNWDIGGIGLRLTSFHTPESCVLDLSSNGGCVVQMANGVPNCSGSVSMGDGNPVVVRLSADFNNPGSGVGPTISFPMAQYGCVPTQSAGGSQPFTALEVIVDTGDDDLRAGSEIDLDVFDATNTSRYHTVLHSTSDARWQDQTEHSQVLALTVPLMLTDIDHFAFAMSNAGNDEWHVEGVDVYGESAAGPETCLVVTSGNPIVKLTNDHTLTVAKALDSCP